MRLPTLARDYWCLVSGEDRHRAARTTFEIPPLAQRKSLALGQGAKLLFEIESEGEDGEVSTSVDRMWVIVSRRVGEHYVGILQNQPASIPADGKFYLSPGAEVPFLPEHVVAIDTPPPEFSANTLTTPPTKRWRSDGA